MRTTYLSTEEKDVKEAAHIIRDGGIVAFPTETVYGLGANALDADAVARIFRAKGRPADNPLIVHVARRDQIDALVVGFPDAAKLLMDRFWPGPLTIVLPKSPLVPKIVSGGLDTVAIRMPIHPVALDLIDKAGVPVAAPSANVSGRPSPTTAAHVREDLSGRIDAIVDGGQCDIGLESTVVDLTVVPAVLLRPGGISFEELEAALGPGNIISFTQEEGLPVEAKSPGMKYRHYAPKGHVILVEGKASARSEMITRLVQGHRDAGKKVGVISTSSHGADYEHIITEPKELARQMFALFRIFDEHQTDVIIVEGVETVGVGLAVMNRLRKAAGQTVRA